MAVDAHGLRWRGVGGDTLEAWSQRSRVGSIASEMHRWLLNSETRGTLDLSVAFPCGSASPGEKSSAGRHNRTPGNQAFASRSHVRISRDLHRLTSRSRGWRENVSRCLKHSASRVTRGASALKSVSRVTLDAHDRDTRRDRISVDNRPWRVYYDVAGLPEDRREHTSVHARAGFAGPWIWNEEESGHALPQPAHAFTLMTTVRASFHERRGMAVTLASFGVVRANHAR